MTFDQGELIVYQSDDGQASIDVRLRDETVWLSQAQMQELFGRERSVITKHIHNIFKEGELDPEAVCAKFARTAGDGKTYQVTHYNLDVIISVGYRMKSQQGTRFRIWATSVLKDHLVRGYMFHQKRLAEKGLTEVRQMLDLLGTTLQSRDLISDEGRAVSIRIRASGSFSGSMTRMRCRCQKMQEGHGQGCRIWRRYGRQSVPFSFSCSSG